MKSKEFGGEWTGAWSKDSELWTDEAKQDYKLKDDDFENGKFFLNKDALVDKFISYGWCSIKDNASLQSVQKSGSTGIYKVKIEEEGAYEFSISQKGERMFPTNSGYRYSPARMHLVKLNGKSLEDGV